MMRSLLTIFILLIGCWNLQSQVTVSAAFDNNKILIGDQAKLHLEANYPTNYSVKSVELTVLDSIFAQVDPSKQGEEPGLMEIISQTKWDTLTNGGTTTYAKDIMITCWEEGVYFIPPITFVFDAGNNFSKATNRLTLLVSSPITQNEAVDTVNIAPIKDIVEEQWQFSDFLPVIYIFGGFLVVLLGIVFLILYIARRRAGPPPIKVIQRPAHEIAFQKLKQLKAEELWQKGEIKKYQSQLTYITREYIENRYKIPALESTTGVILSDLKKGDFPEELTDKMREMLQLADMVKFAKAQPPEEMHGRLMESAEEIVDKTKQVLSEEELKELEAGNDGMTATFIKPTQLAHPGIRLVAYLLDWIFFQVIYSILIIAPGYFLLRNLSPLWIALIAVVAFFVVGFFYFVYRQAKHKQTLGKKVLGIELIQADGQNLSINRAFLRFVVKTISILFFFLPFLLVLFNKQKQALHDMVANSIVVKK